MMKINDVCGAFRAGALSLSLAVLFLAAPVAAQNNNAGTGTTNATRTETRDDARDNRREVRGDNDEDRDWGWLGLLGLAGLLGLMPRKRVPVVVDRDHDIGTRERGGGTTSGRDVGHNR